MTGTPDYPFAVEESDHLWIEMADGVRLAARLWRPLTERAVPAILEYIPYRKTDMVRARDERNHPFFAAHGYACIRVDMRGSGDSEGQMPDMYAPAELDDARQVIAWLAAQSWCNGRVGMFGTSWGGTAALQASVDAPEALKAVIAVCATHDRFEDDIHYMGGCLLSDSFEWGATLPSILASPPTAQAGPDWLERWRERLENLTFPLENWLRASGRGAYWRRGSVIHQADELSVPILSVGGWSDRYSNSVMTLVDARPDLVWGLVGPWGHHYPDHGAPGPAIGFQRLALDWWDHWLKPERPEAPAWPRLRLWLREFDPPGDSLDVRQGRWIESGPGSEEVEARIEALAGMTRTPGSAPWHLPMDPATGLTAGDSGYFGRSGGLPLDQSEDDARSLVFETAPLSEDIVLLGAVELRLNGHSSDGGGQVVARLNDVEPGGQVARISYGLRNLALDENLDEAETPDSAGPFSINLRLHTTAYRVRKGHRVRLALSSALWPLIHRQRQSGSIQITDGSLTLPVMKHEARDLKTDLPGPEDLPRQKTHSVLSAPALKRWRRSSAERLEIGWHQPETKTAFHETDSVFGYETTMTHFLEPHTWRSAAPLSERTHVAHRMTFERPDGRAQIDVQLRADSTEGLCSVEAHLSAIWNGRLLSERHWNIKVARDLPETALSERRKGASG